MKRQLFHLGSAFIASGSLLCLFSCKKLVQVPPPINSITTSQAFSTDYQATEAMAGVYSGMINPLSGLSAFDGGATVYCSASADEINYFTNTNLARYQFQVNQLQANNQNVSTMWNDAYTTIYGCNAVLSGLQGSTAIHDSVRNELIGEAKFVRAFSYFYLLNWFGNLPLVMTIDYNKTSMLPRSSIDTVYSAIVGDLKDAESRLSIDYSFGNGERIVPNRWAAAALLARVYLFKRDWQDAVSASSLVLNNNSLYGLVSDLNGVFLANSTEAIWQLQQSSQIPPYNGTQDGALFVPYGSGYQPTVYVTASLLGAFEPFDQRRVKWIAGTTYQTKTYYYPFKYRIGPKQAKAKGVDSAYYMVLRLAEQYLIRAEAEANGATGGISAAVTDLNVIRNRAGLGPYAGPMVQDSVLNAIYHERQVELFAEWGHRWLDLKRWGNAIQVLSAEKVTGIKSDALAYPIPNNELQRDPNLTQNPGY